MTVLFERVKPENATNEDIKKAINEITEWDWTTGYSFAHIVIDDFNLSDRDILYCLRPSWIAEVMNDKLNDEFYHINSDNVLYLDDWQLSIYHQKIMHMVELIDLLNWLLNTPIEERDKIE